MMPKKQLLITGISGFLGRQLAALRPAGWQLTGLYHRQALRLPDITTMRVDLTDSESLAALLKQLKPDAILHLAAVADPNYCEENPESARAVNVGATLTIAQYCREQSLPFLFISTDMIFDGQHAPYSEEDKPKPVNTYGSQKAEAERGIFDLYPAATVARLPLLYGRGVNFLTGWIDKLQAGRSLPAFTDEFRTPVTAEDAARGLMLLLDQQATGIWHLGGPERLSRYAFAQLIAEVFQLQAELIRASRQKDVAMAAARPADVSLDSRKAFALGYAPKNVRQGLISLR